MEEAEVLSEFIKKNKPTEEFYSYFEGKYSKGFNAEEHLKKIGVVNQTTMLASETEEISNFIKNSIIETYGNENYKDHFADTRDTLCYATNENQKSTYGLLEEEADLAIVVGGYNSSNTSHLVELCERKLPSFFIKSEDELLSKNSIQHFNYKDKKLLTTTDYLPNKEKLKIILTSGASCPDAVVDRVLKKLLSFFDIDKSIEEVINNSN